MEVAACRPQPFPALALVAACSSPTPSGESSAVESPDLQDPDAPATVRRFVAVLHSGKLLGRIQEVQLGDLQIKEVVADREGVVELLEAVGFRVRDEGGELFVVMDEVPSDARLSRSRWIMLLLKRDTPRRHQLRWRLTPRRAAAMGLIGGRRSRRPSDRQSSLCQPHAATSQLSTACCNQQTAHNSHYPTIKDLTRSRGPPKPRALKFGNRDLYYGTRHQHWI